MNILLVQSDQQRRDSLGVYGNWITRTPAIDRLAHDGVAFDYAFTPIPLCGPARASLLTGKRPLKHGIIFNSESGSAVGMDFTAPQRTLTELLAERGCISIHCGKWHIGTKLTPADCAAEGVFYPGYGYPDQHPHYRAYLKSLGVDFEPRDAVYSRLPDGSAGYCLSAILDAPPQAGEPYYVTSQAIEAIRRSADHGKQFFVSANFWGPHAPYIVPKDYARLYDPASIPPWPNFEDDLASKPRIQKAYREYWGIQDFTWEEWSKLVALCNGYVTMIDDQVARLMAALEELGAAQETAVFYTSDHGGMVGAHGLADKGPYLYDEICRVPLIARVPGTPGGRRSDALAYNMDLMPTILELAGCETPNDLDAVSLAPILRGESDAVRPPDEPAYVEFHGHQTPYEQRVVRTPSAKYVFNAPDIDELYDLESDPYELRNVASDPAYANLLRSMHALLEQRLASTRDPLLLFFEGSRMMGSAADSPITRSPTGRVDWE